jgi:hypothetical protein
MSDHPAGPDWWLASDGRWYPPDQTPPVPPPQTWATPPQDPTPRSGLSTGAIVALVIACVVGVLGILVAIGLLVGSDDDDSTVAPAEVPAGFVTVEGDGVSIGTPERWEVIDAADLAMGTEEFAEAFPDAPTGMIEQGLDAVEQGAVLVAFDFSDSAFAQNVNILEVPAEASLAQVGDDAEQQLALLGGEVLASERVELPLGEAARIAYTFPIALQDGTSTPVEGVQYYVPVDGRTYIVTVTAGADLADQMIETFRVS